MKDDEMPDVLKVAAREIWTATKHGQWGPDDIFQYLRTMPESPEIATIREIIGADRCVWPGGVSGGVCGRVSGSYPHASCELGHVPSEGCHPFTPEPLLDAVRRVVAHMKLHYDTFLVAKEHP